MFHSFKNNISKFIFLIIRANSIIEIFFFLLLLFGDVTMNKENGSDKCKFMPINTIEVSSMLRKIILTHIDFLNIFAKEKHFSIIVFS